MRPNIVLRIIIIAISCITPAINTYAEDVLGDEINNLTAIPSVEILEWVKIDWTTQSVRLLKDPNSGNSVGTIKKNDGSLYTITRSAWYNWSTNYSVTNNGVTTTASVNIDGTTTWDANVANVASQINNSTTNTTSDSAAKKVVTVVSEKVPGATCVCYIGGNAWWPECPPGTKISERKYQCTTDAGMTGFQKVFAQMIRFVINIVMLLGVLAVVGLGIAWSFAGWDDMKMKSTLKTWAINLVIGFIILFMFRYILLFLAPWIYK
jgi:hypothetical protein